MERCLRICASWLPFSLSFSFTNCILHPPNAPDCLMPRHNYAKISSSSPRISSTLASIAILSLSSFTSSCASSSNFSSTSLMIPYTLCLPRLSKKFSLENLWERFTISFINSLINVRYLRMSRTSMRLTILSPCITISSIMRFNRSASPASSILLASMNLNESSVGCAVCVCCTGTVCCISFTLKSIYLSPHSCIAQILPFPAHCQIGRISRLLMRCYIRLHFVQTAVQVLIVKFYSDSGPLKIVR